MATSNDNLETPEWVWRALGPFELDPCAGPSTSIADVNWSIQRGEDGLKCLWMSRFFFCNPPFSQKELWSAKCITEKRGGGMLLLPERGSAPWFGPLAQAADAYWVMGKKINFIGGPSSNNVGSVLFLFGNLAIERVKDSGLPGHLCRCEHFCRRANH